MKERTPEEEHRMAMASATYTVRQLGRATLWDVIRQQGLCEVRAKKALEDLVSSGVLMRTPDGIGYQLRVASPDEE